MSDRRGAGRVASRSLRDVVGPVQRGWQVRRLSVCGCRECSISWWRGVAVALHGMCHVALVRVMQCFRMCCWVHREEPRRVLEPLAAVPGVAGGKSRTLSTVSAVVRGIRVVGVGAGEELQWCEGPRDFHWLLADWEATAAAGSAAAVEVLVHAEQVERVVLVEAQCAVVSGGPVVDLKGCLLTAVEERGVLQIVVGRCLDVVFALPLGVAVAELLNGGAGSCPSRMSEADRGGGSGCVCLLLDVAASQPFGEVGSSVPELGWIGNCRIGDPPGLDRAKVPWQEQAVDGVDPAGNAVFVRVA